MHGIVHQEIRQIPDNQAACDSAGNLDIPEQRENSKDGRESDDAYPDRRSNEVVWMRVVHPMKLPNDGHLVVDKTMQQIFNERP